MKIEIYNENFKNQDEMFETISQDLKDKKMVKDSFYKAISEREKKFPTGLRGQARNIAIPHADPEHVNESAYIVVINKTPIKFREMANEASELDINLIIFILSDKPKGHMELLQKTLDLSKIEKDLSKNIIIKTLSMS